VIWITAFLIRPDYLSTQSWLCQQKRKQGFVKTVSLQTVKRPERRSVMEGIYSSQVSIPLFQLMVVLGLISVSLIFGHIKLSLLIGYCAIIYWSGIWNWPLFVESNAWKPSGTAFLMTAFMIIIVLFSALSLIYHKD
jgi:hypothetical protein